MEIQSEINLTTKPDIIRTKVTWTLKDFSTLKYLKVQKFISPIFTLTQSTQTCQFILTLTDDDQEDMSTSNNRSHEEEEKMEECDEKREESYKFHIILHGCTDETSNNLVLKTSLLLSTQIITTVLPIKCEEKNYCLFKITPKSMDSYLTKNNNLRIVCEISDVKNIDSEETNILNENFSIHTNFRKFYENQQLCDIVFVMNDNQIQAHKLVLAAVSPVFADFFSKNNENTLINWFDKENITFEVLKAFLDFIYGCEKFEVMNHLVYDLICLAKKFQVEKLMKACNLYIFDNINTSNVGKILLFSKKFKCTTLTKKAISFAKTCLKEISVSQEFPELAKDKVLMAELFDSNEIDI